MHKAKWIDINRTKWGRYVNNADIVLKCLNNSQNLTTDFLQEVCTVVCIYY